MGAVGLCPADEPCALAQACLCLEEAEPLSLHYIMGLRPLRSGHLPCLYMMSLKWHSGLRGQGTQSPNQPYNLSNL